jgi:hypothetical protein
MKRWAILVAGLYCLILAAETVPLILVAFYPTEIKGSLSAYSNRAYWVWLLVMFLGQAALLTVPVQVASRRPVSRRGLLPTVLASGFMMGGLVAGGLAALWEYGFPKAGGDWVLWALLGVMVLTWCVWSLIFMRLGRTQPPADWVSRQCRALFKGSILELLVAVPAHIAVRQRNDCCAGGLTFIGLITGFSVMLFSFGPAVFFLFAARWKRLHPEVTAKQ